MNFFATSYGKPPCDGIGGTVKRLVTRASLQQPISNQIFTADKMFQFCVEEIKGIDLLFLKNQEIGNIRVNMEERYKRADTVPGTRSFHQFIPISDSIIGAKYVSDDQYYAVLFDFIIVHLLGLGDTLSPSQFVVYLLLGWNYNGSTENLDVKVISMHPKLPKPSLKWLSGDDLCWVPNVHVCHMVSPPELSSQTARMYYFNTSEHEKIEHFKNQIELLL